MPTQKAKPDAGKSPRKPSRTTSLRRSNSPEAGEDARSAPPASALQLAYEVLEHPQEWLRTANSQFGGRRPIDLLGTDEEFKVARLLEAVDAGFFA